MRDDDTLLWLTLITKGGFICRSKMLKIPVISLEDPLVSNFSFIFILYIRQEVALAPEKGLLVVQ